MGCRSRPAMSRSSLHSEENQTLVAILVKARKAAGMTQAELADKLGKPQQFISRLESGQRRIDLLEFIMLARALDLEPRTLLARVLRLLPKQFEV
jgi:transcriptional regulator with XRE-family HTH domain